MDEPDPQSDVARLRLRRDMRKITDDVKRDDVRRDQDKLRQVMDTSDRLLAQVQQSREGEESGANWHISFVRRVTEKGLFQACWTLASSA